MRGGSVTTRIDRRAPELQFNCRISLNEIVYHTPNIRTEDKLSIRGIIGGTLLRDIDSNSGKTLTAGKVWLNLPPPHCSWSYSFHFPCVLQKLNEVLSLFTAARPEFAATDLATLLPYPRSTVYRLIARLTREGFLDQDEVTRLYRLGIWLAALGDIATHSTSLQRLVVPTLRRVSAETEETTTLMLRVGREAIDVDVVESYQPLMTPGLLGGHMPLYASAGGKALLAWLPETLQRELIAPPLKRYTATTITDLNALWSDLDLSRQRGYTTVDGEFLIEVVGVAAPIRNHREEVVGAMTIGGPRSRLTPHRLEGLGQMVVEAARSVSLALGSRGESSHDPGARLPRVLISEDRDNCYKRKQNRVTTK